MHGTKPAVLTVAALFCACAPPQPPAAAPVSGFRHLGRVGASIITHDPIRLTLSAEPPFQATPPTHRRAEFGGHPFEVSMAAFTAADAAVMVHAERVADASGRSNYDALPPAAWPDARFRERGQCVTVDPETAAAEHDLAFLRRHGFDPVGTLALRQYYASTPDHNREVVVSLVARVADCRDEAANEQILSRLRGQVRVER